MRKLLVGLGVALFISLGAGQALAVAANDEIGGAFPLEFGVETAIDTSDTTFNAATDPTSCTTPSGETFDLTGFTAWWRFDNTSDLRLHVNASTFDFLAVVFVFDGSVGDPVGCSAFPAEFSFDGLAGHTYFVMVGSIIDNFGGTGTLVIAQGLNMLITFNPVGTASTSTGHATIGGTMTCDLQTEFTEVFGTLQQRVGRRTITGGFDAVVGPCGPETAEWTAEAEGFNGKYAGGIATIRDAGMVACTEIVCDQVFAPTTSIKLRGSR